MPAVRVRMHLHGNPSFSERCVVNQQVLYGVHGVILGLRQKTQAANEDDAQKSFA